MDTVDHSSGVTSRSELCVDHSLMEQLGHALYIIDSGNLSAVLSTTVMPIIKLWLFQSRINRNRKKARTKIFLVNGSWKPDVEENRYLWPLK